MLLEIKNLQKSYKSGVIFKDLSLNINHYGLYYLKGDNGVGKTTLLNLIASFDREFEGEILIHGEKVDEHTYQKYVSYYNVDYNLIDNMSIKDNLKLINKNYLDLIKKLNLESLLEKDIVDLSKGEKARLGIVKTLLLNKEIMLFDEPFAYLDESTANIYFNLLREYAKNHLIIFVSHVFLVKNYDLNILQIENYKLLLRENELSCFQIKSEQSNTTKRFSFLKCGILFSLKNKAKLISSFILVLITFSFLIPSLNFTFYDNKTVFNDIAQENRVILNESDKNIDTQDNNFYRRFDVSSVNSIQDTSEILVLETEDKSLFISNNNYDFDIRSSELSCYVSEKTYQTTLESKKPFTIRFEDIFNSNITCNVQNFISDCAFDAIFFNTDQLLNILGSQLAYKISGSDLIKKGENFALTRIIIIGSDYIDESSILNSEKAGAISNINDVNMIVPESTYNMYKNQTGDNNYDEYFNKNYKGTIALGSDNGRLDFSKYIDSFNVIGYKVVSDEALNGSTSDCIEISNELKNISDSHLLTTSFLFGNDPKYFDMNQVQNTKIWEDINNCQFYLSSGEHLGSTEEKETIFYGLQTKNVFSTIFLIVSRFFLIISIILLIIFNLSNFKLNHSNIYVLKENSQSNSQISFTLLIPNLISLLISAFISLLLGYLIGLGINAIFTTIGSGFQYFDYFKLSPYTYLVIFGIVLIASLLTLLIYYLVLKKKDTKEFISSKN